MSAFLVISTVPNPRLDQAVTKAYDTACLRIAENVWLVADSKTTTREVTDKLGIDGSSLTNVVVSKVDNYWGRASKDIWEWLAVKVPD